VQSAEGLVQEVAEVSQEIGPQGTVVAPPENALPADVNQPAAQNDAMDIEPQFDFAALGLPENFLELHEIDPEFFYSLTDELRTEVLLDFLPKDSQNEHLEFLNSLPPNLREEVLLTTPEEILLQMPQLVQQEAQALRQRGSFRRYHIMEQEYVGVPARQEKKEKKPRKSSVDVKALLVQKEMGKLLVVEDRFIEKLLEFLFTDDLSFGRFPFELFKTLVLHPQNEYRILDAVIYLLLKEQKQVNDFPPRVLYTRDNIIDDYDEVYEQLSLKILYLLNKCCADNQSYFLDPAQKSSLESVSSLKPEHQHSPFLFLCALFSKPLCAEPEHLANLCSLLCALLSQNTSCPALPQESLEALCQLLPSTDEPLMKKMSQLISQICYERSNLELVMQALKTLILHVSQNINDNVSKALHAVQHASDSQAMLQQIEAQFEEEMSIQKIFKLIKQLLDNYQLQSEQINQIKAGFQSLITGDQLNSLWINITEFMVSLYDHFWNQINVVNPIVHRLTPILECFFIIYKIASDDSTSKAPKGAIEIQEIREDAQVHHIEKSFYEMRREKLDIDDFFTLIADKNKKFINLMVKQNVNILSESLSNVVKKAPHLLDFENKKLYFKSKIKQNRQKQLNYQIRTSLKKG